MSTRYWGYAGPHGEAGPVSTDELAFLLRERLIGVDTAIRPAEGMRWEPLSYWLPELAPFATAAAGATVSPPPVNHTPPPPPSASPLEAPVERPAQPWVEEDAEPFVLTPPVERSLSAGSWTDRAPHPWRRYWARALDTAVMGGITWVLIGFVLAIVAPEPSERFFAFMEQPLGRLVDMLLTIVVAMPGNALLLGLSGGTLGKWLFGIRITRPDGRPIGVFTALWRELRVWVQGLGLGVPLLSLVTMICGHVWLSKDGHTPWDPPRKRLATHRRVGVWQVLLMIIGLALLVAIRVGLTRL